MGNSSRIVAILIALLMTTACNTKKSLKLSLASSDGSGIFSSSGGNNNPVPVPVPSPSPSPSPVALPSPSPKASPLPSPSPSPVALPSPSPSPKASPLPSPSPSPVALPSPSPSPKASPLPSPSPSPKASPAPSPIAGDPTTLPLVQGNQIVFVGKFAVDSGNFGSGTFSYGGYGLSVWNNSGVKTLFMSGNDQNFGLVGQIQIPPDSQLKPASTSWSSLNTATILQGLANITPGFSGFDPNNGNPDWLFGTLFYNNRLILAGSYSYSFNQNVSLGAWATPGKLSNTSGNFTGFFASNAAASPRAVGGYLFSIPAEWQSSMGGPVFAGECCISVIRIEVIP